MESYPLVTLEEVKEFFDVRPEVTKLDARYTALAKLATTQIEQATGRFLTRQEHVEFFTSRDNTRIDYDLGGAGDFNGGRYTNDQGLRSIVNPQIIYLAGVNIDPDADFDVWYDPNPAGQDGHSDRDLLRRDDHYGIDYENDAVVLYVSTRYRLRGIKVRYTAGYPEADGTLSGAAPSYLKTAALIQTQFLNVKLRADNVGMDSERTVSGKDRVHSAPFMARGGLTPEAASIVASLKRVRTGKG
jgi:hypothetical protein